jgi:hypothetical protein
VRACATIVGHCDDCAPSVGAGRDVNVGAAVSVPVIVAVEIDAVASGGCPGVQAASKAAIMINAREMRRIGVSLIQEILQQIGRAR